MRIEREKQKIIVILLCAFIGGIIYANLMNEQTSNVTLFHHRLLGEYMENKESAKAYLIYLFKNRLLFSTLFFVSATTKYRKIFAYLFLIWNAFAAGLLAVTAVIQMGASGMIIYIVAFIPHYFFYILGYALVVWYCVRFPHIMWGIWKSVFVAASLGSGIILEACANPYLLNAVMNFIR